VRWMNAAGAAAAALCLIGDLTMITMFVASGMPPRPLAAMALAASLARVACGITAMRQAIRMRR